MNTIPTAFDFSLPGLDGSTIDLSEYRGRPLLIANTASRCGFTPQYAGLQRMWDTYRERGLVVLAVPSNDFGGQEPGTAAEIGAFCQKNYGVSFPVAGKQRVTGSEAHALFRFFGGQAGFLARPRWNFYKYIIGRDGRLASWFSSVTPSDSGRIRRVVEQTLKT